MPKPDSKRIQIPCPRCLGAKKFEVIRDWGSEFEDCLECAGIGEIIVLRNGPGNQQEIHHGHAKMESDND